MYTLSITILSNYKKVGGVMVLVGADGSDIRPPLDYSMYEMHLSHGLN